MAKRIRITEANLQAQAAQDAAAIAARGTTPVAPALPLPPAQGVLAPSTDARKLAGALKFIDQIQTDNAVLHKELTEQDALIAALRKQLAEAEAIAGLGKSFKQPKPARPAREVPQWELDRVAAMAKARAEAKAGKGNGKAVPAEF